jgi:bacterioferritin
LWKKGKEMNEKVVQLLNSARAAELTAIAQYMTHHYELAHADLGKTASRIKEIAIEEMKHAEDLAERILFLKGIPTTQPETAAKKGQEISEMFVTDLALEERTIAIYNEAAVMCAAEKDHMSKLLFEKLLEEEERHLRIFEKIKNHVDRLGGAYLAGLVGS